MSKLKLSKISTCFTCLTCLTNGNTRSMCKICLHLSIKTPKWRHWRRFGVFSFNFEQISHILWCFSWFEQLNAGCVHGNSKKNRILLLMIVEKLPSFSIFMNFITIYLQLYHFTIWPQRNSPLHNFFRKIFQFADIIYKSNFFPWKFPTNFFLSPKNIIKNKCNHSRNQPRCNEIGKIRYCL